MSPIFLKEATISDSDGRPWENLPTKVKLKGGARIVISSSKKKAADLSLWDPEGLIRIWVVYVLHITSANDFTGIGVKFIRSATETMALVVVANKTIAIGQKS